MVLIESFAAYAHFLAHFGYMLRVWVCTIESMPSKYTELCACVGVRTPSRVCAYESVCMLLQSFLRSNAYNMETEKTHAVRLLSVMLYFKPKTRFFFNFMKKWTIFSPFWRETMLWVCNVIFLLPPWLDISSFCICPNKDDYQLSLHWPQVKHHSNSSTSWYTPVGCATWSSFYRHGWIYHPSASAQTRMIISFLCIGLKSNITVTLLPHDTHPNNVSSQNGLEKVHFWHFFLKNWNVKAFATHEPK